MGRINRNGLDSTYSGISVVLCFDNYLRVEYSIRVPVRKFCKGFFFVFSFFIFDRKKTRCR